MEQAHTQLIAQLNERILAADNTPLYIKFAETVKNAVRSGVLRPEGATADIDRRAEEVRLATGD